MNELEKVISGLACCTQNVRGQNTRPCDGCPYDIDGKAIACNTQLMADALALLKAQEPRVMTLEEVAALPDGSVVWLEDCDKPDVIAGIVMDELITTRELGSVVVLIYFVVVRGSGIIDRVAASVEDYRIRWRCWTWEPSKEHREAISWS